MEEQLTDRWRALDQTVRRWWDADLRTATPAQVAADPSGTLLPLPHPYSSAGGAEPAFAEMYGWDTHFINLGMLAHGRRELVADHLRNLCAMVEEHGVVLNGNRSYYLTRSQPPVMADSLARYLAGGAGDEADLALRERCVAALSTEYRGYWQAPHHDTPLGLATNRDLGDPGVRPELAAEAETGLDFTPLFAGDVRRCVPLITNCALVRTAEVLAELTTGSVSREWASERDRRAELVRRACWDPVRRFFVELDVVSGERLPVRSLAAYLTLWAGLATPAQARALVDTLPDFAAPGGLTFTDRAHPSPHPEWADLQWQFPAAWPPAQVWVTQGLIRYGYRSEAQGVAQAFLSNQLLTWERTGALWEKYDALSGGVEHLPVERYPSVPVHGWSSAAVAVLGRVALGFSKTRPSPTDLCTIQRHGPST